MAVISCHLCESDPLTKRRYGNQGLVDGELCPICQTPTCRYHLTTVRWKWRENGESGSALICKNCKNAYQHRTWDVHRRDWIT